jgi:hypothetical protein
MLLSHKDRQISVKMTVKITGNIKTLGEERIDLQAFSFQSYRDHYYEHRSHLTQHSETVLICLYYRRE